MQHRFLRCAHCGVPHEADRTHCPSTGLVLSVPAKGGVEALAAPLPGRRDVKRGPMALAHTELGEQAVLDGRYRLLHVLGEGGMGTVWAAEHLLLGKLVAVKVLLPQHLTDASRARFEREARIASALGHPSVVTIYDLGYAADGSPYLVMEYLEGLSLADRIEQRGQLSLRESLLVMEHVLGGLSAAHEKGIVHRDLKPENIFLAQQESGRVRAQLLDFGISKATDESAMSLTLTGTVLGTPYYLAPEQARGERDMDHRVDIWAAGVVLYEMLTGSPPFVADNYNALLVQILMEDAVPPSRVRPDLPLEVDAIVLRALERDRTLRFESARHMLEALDRLAPKKRVRSRARLTSEALRSVERPVTQTSTDGAWANDAHDADDITEVSDSFSFSLVRTSLLDPSAPPDDIEIDIDIDIVFESQPLHASQLRPIRVGPDGLDAQPQSAAAVPDEVPPRRKA